MANVSTTLQSLVDHAKSAVTELKSVEGSALSAVESVTEQLNMAKIAHEAAAAEHMAAVAVKDVLAGASTVAKEVPVVWSSIKKWVVGSGIAGAIVAVGTAIAHFFPALLALL